MTIYHIPDKKQPFFLIGKRVQGVKNSRGQGAESIENKKIPPEPPNPRLLVEDPVDLCGESYGRSPEPPESLQGS